MSADIRRWLAGSAAVVAAVGLVGCSPSGPGESSPSGEGQGSTGGVTTVTMWGRETGAPAAAVEKFNATHTDIQIELSIVPDAEIITKYAQSVRAGTAPDLIGTFTSGPLLAAQGMLEDLTDRVEALPNRADLAVAAMNAGLIEGRTYTVPLGVQGSQLYWNKTLFEQAGLDPEKPPATLEEVKAIAEKLSELPDVIPFSTIGSTGGAWTGFPSIWASGGEVLTPAGPDQQAVFDNDTTKAVLAWYRDMWTSGLMAKTDQPNQDPGGVGLQNAHAGKVGMAVGGGYIVVGTEGAEWGYLPGIPGFVNGSLGSFAGGDVLGITAGSPKVDAAWAFLEWAMTSEDNARAMASTGNAGPDLALASRVAEEAGDQLALSQIATIKVGSWPASIAYGPAIDAPTGPYNVAAQAIVFEGVDPDEALAKAQADANALIKEAYDQV